jgi:hypothetical protein
LFSTILSLVFVPAMFMVMDDIGSLTWRFGRKLIVSGSDTEHSDSHKEGETPDREKPAAAAE